MYTENSQGENASGPYSYEKILGLVYEKYEQKLH